MPTVELPDHVDEAQARLLLAIALFQEELISVGKGAEIAGLSYRAFLDELKQRGIPAYRLDYTDEEFEAELRTARQLGQARKDAEAA